jgi:hypothetical protein
MPRTIRPVPVEITSDKSTLVRVDVPCIIQGVNVKSKLDALEQGIVNLNGTVIDNASTAAAAAGAGTSATTALSSSVATDLDTIRASIPAPGGSTNSVQYKASSTSFGGSADFVFNPSTVSLTLGTGVVVGNSIQVAVGKYNTSSNSNGLLIVGNGTNAGSRKDIFAANRDGQISFGGGVQMPLKRFIYPDDIASLPYKLTKEDYYLLLINNDGSPQQMASLPTVGSVPVGTTYCVKNSYLSASDVDITFTNAYVDGNGSPLTLVPNKSNIMVLAKIDTSVFPNIAYWETFANT